MRYAWLQVHTPWVTKRMPRWRFEGLDSLSVHAYSQDQADYVTQGTLQVLTDMAPTVPVRKLTIANSCVDTALMSVIAPMWGWDVRLIECAVYDNPVTLFNQYTPCVTVLQLAPDYNGPVQLTDKVLQSLVEQCPCLKELTVCGVHLEASHAHRTVEHLRVLRVLEHPEQRESVWTHLERLPLPKHEPYYVQTETGVAAVLPPVVMSSTQVRDFTTYLHVRGKGCHVQCCEFATTSHAWDTSLRGCCMHVCVSAYGIAACHACMYNDNQLAHTRVLHTGARRRMLRGAPILPPMQQNHSNPGLRKHHGRHHPNRHRPARRPRRRTRTRDQHPLQSAARRPAWLVADAGPDPRGGAANRTTPWAACQHDRDTLHMADPFGRGAAGRCDTS